MRPTSTSAIPSPASSSHQEVVRAIRISVGLLMLLVWVRTAWLCDDAFITLRHVDHLLRGYGPVFNVGERVIGFTHPLWFLLLVPIWGATKSAAATFFLASAGASIAAVWVLLRRLPSSWTAVVVAGAALLASRSFVDWSSSGLENPLSHLLVVVLAVETLGRTRVGRLSLITALLGLTRPELVLLGLPATLLGWRRSNATVARKLRAVSIGFAPLVVWHVGALLWSGSLVPNTALAKLPPNLGLGEVVQQGLLYLLSSVVWDPPTLLVIALGLATVGRCSRRLVLGLGVVLGLVAVVRVGGDFMNGRFLTPIFVLAVILLATSRWSRDGRAACLIAATLLLAGSHSSHLLRAPWGAPEEGRVIDPRGVADERAWYGKWTSLSTARRGRPLPRHELVKNISAQWDRQGRIAVVEAIGLLAWHAGPGIHVVDRNGLTDPLLARLPFARTETWRPGHLARDLPPGYRDSLQSGANQLADPCVHALYDDVLAAARGPLGARGRPAAIVRLLVHDTFGAATSYPRVCGSQTVASP